VESRCRRAPGQREIDLLRIQDEPYYAVRVGARPEDAKPGGASRPGQAHVDGGDLDGGRVALGRLLVAADTFTLRKEPFTSDSLLKRLTAAVPDVAVLDSELLAEYDAYYYARGYARERQAPLPVLRVKFGDPMETWVYVDPALGRIVGREHRYTRVERWLFNGLHSLDFAFWYDRRPLWDVGVIALSLGGLASSGIGLWLGFGRMRRAVTRWRFPSSVFPRQRAG